MPNSTAINFDRNSTYGLLPEVVEGLRSLDFPLGNPSSVHSLGQRARAKIEEARESLSKLLDLRSTDRIVFTSGATEANNLAIHLVRADLANRHLKLVSEEPLILHSAIEHPSLLEPINRALSGTTVGVYPREDHKFYADDFLKFITLGTRLVTAMLANNETGQILPLSEIGIRMREDFPRVYLHTDAVQAIGKIPVSVRELGVDMLSLSGHKFGALSGIGALIVSDRINPSGLIVGGPQEARLRAGTENLIGIISLGIAAEAVRRNLETRRKAFNNHRGRLLEQLAPVLGDDALTIPLAESLPNTLHLRIKGVNADDLVVALDLRGVCASSGAACASGKPEPSHVLLAMGMNECTARECIRFSLGVEHSAAEIERGASAIVAAIQEMRSLRKAG